MNGARVGSRDSGGNITLVALLNLWLESCEEIGIQAGLTHRRKQQQGLGFIFLDSNLVLQSHDWFFQVMTGSHGDSEARKGPCHRVVTPAPKKRSTAILNCHG